MKRQNFLSMIGLAAIPIGSIAKKKSKKISIEKFDNGTFTIDGCDLDEFNRDGGMIVHNIGEITPDCIVMTARIVNGFTGRNIPYSLKLNVSKFDDYNSMCDALQLFNCMVEKTAKRLIGHGEWSPKHPIQSTYKEAEDDYLKKSKKWKTHGN